MSAIKGAKPAAETSSDKQISDNEDGIVDAINRVQAIIEFNVDGTILSANENYLACTGYSLDDLKGQHHRMLCDPKHAGSEDHQDFWLELSMAQSTTGEYKRVGKDGKGLWLHEAYSSVMDDEGKPTKILCVATDITARKEAEAVNLRKTTGFENSTAAMMTVDRDFIVTGINQATKELMARSADAFAEVWPDFDPKNIIGTCIDQFHKAPAHQRKLLSDPKNLPWRTDITIGDFKFALNVGGIFDEQGEYVGKHARMGRRHRGADERGRPGCNRSGAGQYGVHPQGKNQWRQSKTCWR